jgi:hypothetical protein
MTKSELISALTTLPDDADVLMEPCPAGRGWHPPEGELFGIEVEIIEGDGKDNPTFAHIKPDRTRPDDVPRG